MSTIMKVAAECMCNREIESLVPWHEGFSNGSNYLRCIECGHINDVEIIGEYE